MSSEFHIRKVTGKFLSTFVTILIIGICICSSIQAQQTTEIRWKKVNDVLIPVPPPEHPRLYLRGSDIAELGKRLESPLLQTVIDSLDKQSAGILQVKIEWDAVKYLITNDLKLGRTIIDSTLVLLKRTGLPEFGDAARVTGRMMVTGAIIYDWLYTLITPAEKEIFIQELVRLAKTLECGYPPTGQGSITGHSSESFIMRDMISAGIAIYDEYPEMYELAAARFFREHLPARNWFYPGHAYHQGDSYGPLRFSWDTYPLKIFSRMGAGNVYNPEQQYVPYFYIYTTRPDGQRMRAGNNYFHANHGAPPGSPWDQYSGTLYTASHYGDGVLLEQFMRQGAGNPRAHGRISQYEYIFHFLWWDLDLQPEPLNTLPLSRYFGSPFGWTVARTGWDENSVIAEMKINEYNFNNHQHMDAGSFQIYHHGPLATESGLYAGTDGAYNSNHCRNYYWRTVAHNSLLIYDPDEQFDHRGLYSNDGGQRLVNHRYEPRTLEMLLDPENGYKTGEVLTQGFGPCPHSPDYTYLKGDITKAYSSKVDKVKRSFVFLNLHDNDIPAALIVFDKVISVNPEFEKFWLLHSIEEPVIDGNEVIITRTTDGDRGKLVNTVLLPEADNTRLKPVGGPGKEFWVFGTNYENHLRQSLDESTHEHSGWRIELSPEKPAREDYFLNIMQVMENHRQQLNVKRLDGTNLVGVQIADRLVFFGKDSEEIISAGFTINDDGNSKVLLTDLTPGTWQVVKDGHIVIPAVNVKGEDGILYFTGTKGDYSLIRKQ